MFTDATFPGDPVQWRILAFLLLCLWLSILLLKWSVHKMMSHIREFRQERRERLALLAAEEQEDAEQDEAHKKDMALFSGMDYVKAQIEAPEHEADLAEAVQVFERMRQELPERLESIREKAQRYKRKRLSGMDILAIERDFSLLSRMLKARLKD